MFCQVLRTHDSRLCQSKRSPAIDLDQNSSSILGEGASYSDTIFSIDSATHNSFGIRCSWPLSQKTLIQVVSTPYREGSHLAMRPKHFLPIIAQLQDLHGLGFVHGDIRAFNTVFSNEVDFPAYLIGFDLGGQHGKATYPKCYQRQLDDGSRIGVGGGKLLKWHDWNAMGKLIFFIHKIVPPEGVAYHYDDYALKEFWTSGISTDPSQDDIDKLEWHLQRLNEAGWRVVKSDLFSQCFDGTTEPGFTKKGATGSPPPETRGIA